MKNKAEKTINLCFLIEIGLSIILLIVSWFLKDTPKNRTYTYENGQILVHSWQNVYRFIVALLFFTLTTLVIISIIVFLIKKIKHHETTKINPLIASLSKFLLCTLFIGFSYILVIGAWTREGYDSRCYEFSDGKHMILIEEKSFLLSGSVTVYQIKDHNKAIVIHRFNTDDGHRNNGEYELVWHDDSVEITYNMGNLSNQRCTKKCVFVND